MTFTAPRLAVVAASLAVLACPRDPRTRVDALLETIAGDQTPGVAALVIENGTAVYSSARGMADLEKSVPVGPRTTFDLASVSKQFTGVLAMMLHQEGRLDYDAPVVRILPELSRFGPDMTVRHLLTHTSGLPDYYEALAGSAAPGAWFSNRQALGFLAQWSEPAVFLPGDRFAYSDVGYEMLALVLESAGGEPFGDLLERRILEPLEMRDTRLRDRPDVPVPNRALGYTLRGQGFVPAAAHPMDYLAGSGAINTTLEDLRRFYEALDGERLVTRATLEEALQPMRLNDGGTSAYAFGWFLKHDLWRRRLEHPGAWNGYQAFVVRYPESRFTVVLLANRSDVDLGVLADSIVRLYAGLLGPR